MYRSEGARRRMDSLRQRRNSLHWRSNHDRTDIDYAAQLVVKKNLTS
jgi:hypothetical protein